jgi:DNA-binding transcriptional LysR family regulator
MLLEEAVILERGAVALAAGSLPELRLAVDTTFPTWLLLSCLERFAEHRPETRIELYETVLDGTEELLREGRVDLAIGWRVPAGLLADSLVRLRFVTVAHPAHPLHALGRPVAARDLRRHRHLVMRDSAVTRSASEGPLTAGPRWTLSSKASAIRAACMGLGFSSFPEESIRSELEQGALKELPLAEGGERFGELYLIYADRDLANADVRQLAELLRERVHSGCKEAVAS